MTSDAQPLNSEHPPQTNLWVLDLFCGAGGAAMGYHRAGFNVVGVDIAPQPNYPFDFVQMDALEWTELATFGNRWADFALIHASPPCQAYSTTRTLHDTEYPTLIEPVREALKATGLPYVIENVVGAPLVRRTQSSSVSRSLGR